MTAPPKDNLNIALSFIAYSPCYHCLYDDQPLINLCSRLGVINRSFPANANGYRLIHDIRAILKRELNKFSDDPAFEKYQSFDRIRFAVRPFSDDPSIQSVVRCVRSEELRRFSSPESMDVPPYNVEVCVAYEDIAHSFLDFPPLTQSFFPLFGIPRDTPSERPQATSKPTEGSRKRKEPQCSAVEAMLALNQQTDADAPSAKKLRQDVSEWLSAANASSPASTPDHARETSTQLETCSHSSTTSAGPSRLQEHTTKTFSGHTQLASLRADFDVFLSRLEQQLVLGQLENADCEYKVVICYQEDLE